MVSRGILDKVDIAETLVTRELLEPQGTLVKVDTLELGHQVIAESLAIAVKADTLDIQAIVEVLGILVLEHLVTVDRVDIQDQAGILVIPDTAVNLDIQG